MIKKHWYKLSIKTKQILFFAVIILGISLISFYLHLRTYYFINEFRSNLQSYFTVNKLFIQIRNNAQFIDRYLKYQEMESDEDFKEEFDKNVESILELINKVDKESDNSLETYFLMRAIKNATTVYLKECDMAIAQKMTNDESSAYYLHYYKAQHIGEYIEGYISQLLYSRLNQSSYYYEDLAQRAMRSRMFILAAITAMTMLCLLFSFIFSNYLTRSIRSLANASIRMAHGDLEVGPIELNSADEVGALANSFNLMSENIKKMFNDLKEKSEIEKKLHEEEMENMRINQLLKESEFLSLQSQINPHFLFNTLNAIARTSMFENATNTTTLIQTLSNLFRYNLMDSSQLVTLKKELECIEQYIYIQQYRFGSRLQFELDCQAGTEEVALPCFTLQPLVENAIIHGIEPKEEGGYVRIRVRKRFGFVQIKIIDNGVGFPKDKLNDFLNMQKGRHEGHATAIGVSNVYSRLKYFTNDMKCLSIRSKSGVGTVITLNIPERKVESDYV
jgi:sensor histidine kinase YesM